MLNGIQGRKVRRNLTNSRCDSSNERRACGGLPSWLYRCDTSPLLFTAETEIIKQIECFQSPNSSVFVADRQKECTVTRPQSAASAIAASNFPDPDFVTVLDDAHAPTTDYIHVARRESQRLTTR